MRRSVVRALALLLLAVALPGSTALPAAAHHTGTVKTVDASIAETVTLSANNYSAYTMFLESGETINYEIHVVSGGNIDVYFVLTGGLLNYTSDTAVSIQAYALFENERNFTGTFDRATGAVTVIIDNVDFAGALPAGPVTVTVSLTKNTPVYLAAIVLIGFGAALLAVALVFVLLRRRRKRETTLPPSPGPYAGPYAGPSAPLAQGPPPAGPCWPVSPPPPPRNP